MDATEEALPRQGRFAPCPRALGFAFDHLGIERVYGLTGVDNVAAQRSTQRAGLSREGVLRGVIKSLKGRLDQVCFGVLASDRLT
jgi:RimJ/RimL family protein N-acetyltransferase